MEGLGNGCDGHEISGESILKKCSVAEPSPKWFFDSTTISSKAQG